MKVYNVYILVVAVVLLLTTVVMSALNQTRLTSYYALYVIEALVITELFVYFNAGARRRLNLVSAVLFVGFVMAVALQLVGGTG